MITLIPYVARDDLLADKLLLELQQRFDLGYDIAFWVDGKCALISFDDDEHPSYKVLFTGIMVYYGYAMADAGGIGMHVNE